MNHSSHFAGGKSQSLFYDLGGEAFTFCPYCNTKYADIDSKHAACQKVEVLQIVPENSGDRSSEIHLAKNVLTCWLVEPFIGCLSVGDMVNLTGYFYLTPKQKIVNQRCVSPISPSLVVFNIAQVNPFN
jgi:hypothetical protein